MKSKPEEPISKHRNPNNIENLSGMRSSHMAGKAIKSALILPGKELAMGMLDSGVSLHR